MTREQLLSQLNHRLGEGFVDFGAEPAARNEALALCDEQLMEKMLDAGTLTDADIIPAVARRTFSVLVRGSAAAGRGGCTSGGA